jgi:predicted transcriptional regulator
MRKVNSDVENAGGNLNKNRSVRLGDTLDELIDKYAVHVGKKPSRIIREVLMEGLFQRTKAAQFQHFEEWLIKREAFTLLNKCEKCGSEHNLGFYHIDGNINNTAANNIVTLCIPCLNAFQNWKMKQNIKEKFIEWFFA